MKVVFPYFGQFHQVLHSLPIAVEMSRRHPDAEVHVAGDIAHLAFVRRMIDQYASGAPLVYDALRDPVMGGLASRHLTMIQNRKHWRHFDAIVVPERTSLFLRHLAADHTQLIWTRHGAGDRAIGFASDVWRFDFVTLAGRKIEKRLLESRLIRPGDYEAGVYAKFDWARRRSPDRLFDNDRPTVVYNPHFRQRVSSWPSFGFQVLDYFARSERYNLVFAPHLRMFDPPRPWHYEPFRRYMNLPHMRIDLGSERSIDMTYVNAAQLYLGDVSSQAYEFISRPRPCLFLNAHRAQWQGDPDYGAWSLGPVIDDLEDFDQQLRAAFDRHAEFREIQERHFSETFGIAGEGMTSARGADAIAAHLQRVLARMPAARDSVLS